MTWKSHLPLIKFAGTFVLPIMYIGCFASNTWVTTKANKEYGLWKWCYQKYSTDTTNAYFINDTHCHSISPGDSAGYYEAVRTVACFTLVLHLLYFGSCNPKEGLGQRKKPCVIALASMIGATVTVSILGACYKDDPRWKDDDPSLSWCYWLITVTAILNGVMCWVCWMFDEMSKPPAPNTTAPANTTTTTTTRTTTTTTTTTATASSSSTPTSAGTRKIPPSLTPVGDTGGGGSSSSISGANRPSGRGATPSTGSAAASAAGAARLDTRESSQARFPILTLPQYNITMEPWEGVPRGAPPSYEEVIRGGTLSPPPPYLPPENNR